MHHGIAFTAGFVTPAQMRQWTIYTRQQMECIFADIRKQVPQGVTAYVHGPTSTLTWRMAELATPWLAPQEANPPTASWRLFLVYVPSRTDCRGLGVKVYHL